MPKHILHGHEHETAFIYRCLIEDMGSQRAAARALGISLNTFQNRLNFPEIIRRESHLAALYIQTLLYRHGTRPTGKTQKIDTPPYVGTETA